MIPSLFLGYTAIIVGAASNIASVYMMKAAHGFTKPVPSVLAIAFIILTQFLASYAMRCQIPMGLVIALITLLIMAGSAVLGSVFFNEKISRQRLIGLLLTMIGVTIASLGS